MTIVIDLNSIVTLAIWLAVGIGGLCILGVACQMIGEFYEGCAALALLVLHEKQKKEQHK